MRKRKLVDGFCGGGGATKGYQRAGFYVVGVDIKPQPHYCGDEFIQVDFMDFPLEGYDAVHTSPPCQRFTALSAMWNSKEHPDLLTPTREKLRAWGGLYVIENVEGAPMPEAFTLCGSIFGLGSGDAELRRHRQFETNIGLVLVPPCWHNQRAKSRVIGVYGGHGRDRRRRFNTQGFSTEQRREAMGIDWMTGEELSQAIPPAFTEFIGAQLLAALKNERGAA